MDTPGHIAHAIEAARAGDKAAFARLVEATQSMAYAVAWQVLRQEADVRDVVQEAYLTAFRRLGDLADADAFPGWLRRIVVSLSLNHRRRARTAWVPLSEEEPPPILDEGEQRWTDDQRRRLSRALLTLSEEERRLCELYYHGRRSLERLALEAGVDPTAMRKRLQRVRDKLRKEIEMDEQNSFGGREVPKDLPASIVELLARPRLVHLAENPVGAMLGILRDAFAEFAPIEVPEELDLDAATERLGGDAVYIDRGGLQRIQSERVLRYDLTLPLLLTLQSVGVAAPRRLATAGKVYRRETESATHLEAFNQLELFAIDERKALDSWSFAGRILGAIDRALPGSEVRMSPTTYPMCPRAWSLDVLHRGQWVEVMAWGEYADWVLRGIGADPERYGALGAGFGLERAGGAQVRDR